MQRRNQTKYIILNIISKSKSNKKRVSKKTLFLLLLFSNFTQILQKPAVSFTKRFYNKANEMKSFIIITRDFVANVFHELKTPFTSINVFAKVLENGMINNV